MLPRLVKTRGLQALFCSSTAEVDSGTPDHTVPLTVSQLLLQRSTLPETSLLPPLCLRKLFWPLEKTVECAIAAESL